MTISRAVIRKGNRTIPDYLTNLLSHNEESEIYPQRIYTTGYTGKDVILLPNLLDRLEAVLIDVRFAPGSSQLEWRRDYLELLLKKRYLHVSHLGNRSYREEGKIAIQNLSLGIKVITELRVNLLLMCACEKPKECHRRVITEAFAEKGIEVEEIQNWEEAICQQRLF